MATTLIITGDRNVHKKDYEYAFKPEAERFKEVIPYVGRPHTLIKIDVSQSMNKRRQQLFDLTNDLDTYTHGSICDIAFFMHGWRDGIQCGLTTSNTIDKFIKILIPKLNAKTGREKCSLFHVILYCCLTGGSKVNQGGDGGFADKFRDELCKNNLGECKVYSHTTAGHTTRNPYVRIFEGHGSKHGSIDGQWVVRPKSKGVKSPLWSLWKKALWSKGQFSGKKRNDLPEYFIPSWFMQPSVSFMSKDFRFFAPFMTIEEVNKFLEKNS